MQFLVPRALLFDLYLLGVTGYIFTIAAWVVIVERREYSFTADKSGKKANTTGARRINAPLPALLGSVSVSFYVTPAFIVADYTVYRSYSLYIGYIYLYHKTMTQ